MILKSEVRAEAYRDHAKAASAMAQACVLQRHRTQHEVSAAAWTRLAEQEDRRSQIAREDRRPPAVRAAADLEPA